MVLAMRLAPQVLALLLAAPTFADDWQRYENSRFGYGIDVPPGFTWGRESDNGDGRAFRDGARRLSVWGGRIAGGDFESTARTAIGFATDDGWTVTDQVMAPGWMSYSVTQGMRVRHERMVALCDGQYAAFRLEYPATDIGPMNPVVERLAETLTGGC
jgi:hypothetical protein